MVILQRTAVLWLVLMLICIVGHTKAEAISEKQEIEVGRSVAKEVEKHYGLVQDNALQARVQKIGMSLVAVCDRPKLPYTFKVLNSKEVNAFAAPGGFIYIFKGLVELMPSDEELAGVMAHELGHVVKRHSVHQEEKNQFWLAMELLAALKGQGLAAEAIREIAMPAYSREDEREADSLGFIYVLRAGYNPYSTLLSMKKLSETEQPYDYGLYADHPETQLRIKAINKYLSDSKIYPQVKELDSGAAQVVEGEWNLPVLYTENNGYKPIYRAYFAAGNLYLIRRLPDYNVDKYILDSDGDNVTVYYEDKAVITLTIQDAAGQNMNLMDFAGLYIERLKSWSH
ncbi:MAG: M48 family metallopeptidase [Pelosinus sp.]|nr:M48 family metallopeptidase [Pelosinus sp.]